MNKPEPPLRDVSALPTLMPVQKLTLREQVAQAVRLALMNGLLRPGQPVTVKSIATMVRASVMPAREAMTQLITEGALELRPNRTVIVPALSRQEFNELTDLRCHIEALAAAQAVEGVGGEHIARLGALDNHMRAAVPVADLDAYLNANFEFHFLIYRLGASRFFLSFIERLWVRVGPLIRFSLNETGLAHSTRHHAEVIRGLEQRDAELLRAAIRADIAGAAQTIRAARDAANSWH